MEFIQTMMMMFMFFFIAEGSVEGEEQVLKVRLSTTSKDVKLPVRSTDTIATAKRKLEVMESNFESVFP